MGDTSPPPTVHTLRPSSAGEQDVHPPFIRRSSAVHPPFICRCSQEWCHRTSWYTSSRPDAWHGPTPESWACDGHRWHRHSGRWRLRGVAPAAAPRGGLYPGSTGRARGHQPAGGECPGARSRSSATPRQRCAARRRPGPGGERAPTSWRRHGPPAPPPRPHPHKRHRAICRDHSRHSSGAPATSRRWPGCCGAANPG
jgi:hypothetical protein